MMIARTRTNPPRDLGPLLGARDLLLPEVVVVLVDLLLQRLLPVPE